MFPAALSQGFTDDAVIFTGRGLYRGFSFADTGGSTACLLSIYDAASTSDTAKLIDQGAIIAGGLMREGPFNNGLAVERGLMVVCSAATRGVIFYNTETRVGESVAVFADGTHDLTALALAELIERLP